MKDTYPYKLRTCLFFATTLVFAVTLRHLVSNANHAQFYPSYSIIPTRISTPDNLYSDHLYSLHGLQPANKVIMQSEYILLTWAVPYRLTC